MTKQQGSCTRVLAKNLEPGNKLVLDEKPGANTPKRAYGVVEVDTVHGRIHVTIFAPQALGGHKQVLKYHPEREVNLLRQSVKAGQA